jgi:hypothetical protein
MNAKTRLSDILIKLRRREFSYMLIKFLLTSIFVLLIPFLIYEKFQSSDFFTFTILLFAELLFILVMISLFKSAREFYSIKNSRIYQCIEKPDRINEIIISKNRILFELKGMEDECIYIKESKTRSDLLKNITSVFGESKIVKN